MKKIYALLGIYALLTACTPTKEVEKETVKIIETTNNQTIKASKVKNIILLIGDGMGLSQVSSSFHFGATEEPNFVRFPYIGLSRTSSAKQKVTDSASGAVAFASGIKTYNGAIGKDVDKQDVETIIERVENQNIATGLIATSSITHATPACFYAHVNYRKQEEDIAAQMVTSSVDFFAGGGLQFFNKRTDGNNLLPDLAAKGFVVDTSSLGTVGALRTDKKYGYLLADKGLPSKPKGRGDFLTDATLLALDYLSRSNDGFFLMVEGSQIDWGGHATSVDYVVQEVRDFDKAIGAALDFAEKDGETLVIVTADHETGGFSLSPPYGEYQENFGLKKTGWDYRYIEGSFYQDADTIKGSAAHTATMVPVFAFGPGSQRFAGVYQNYAIFHKMVKAAGW